MRKQAIKAAHRRVFFWLVALFALAFVLLSGAFAQQERKCSPEGGQGWWSSGAVGLCTTVEGTVPDDTRDIRIYSPDRQKLVRVVKEDWWVEIGSQKLSLPPLPPSQAHVEYPAEMSWAPDSRAFYMTWSNGSIRGFRTYVFRVDRNRLTLGADLNRTAQSDFDLHHKCVFIYEHKNFGGEPNIAGLTWINASDQLLIVAEVPPDGICDHSGYFGGYLVSVSDGHILKRFSPLNLEKMWGSILGDRLRGNLGGLTSKEKMAMP